MGDAKLLLLLRAKHARWTLDRLMHLVGAGIDEGTWTERAYQLYALGIVAVWFALMASALIYGVREAFALADAEACALALRGALAAPAVLLAWGGVRGVRASPLKLSHPDIAYVAASPLSARALVGTAASAQALASAAAFGILGFLVGVGLESAGASAVPPAALALVLAAMALAAVVAGWLAGVVRLGSAGWRGRTAAAVGLAFVAMAVAWVAAVLAASAPVLLDGGTLEFVGGGALVAGLVVSVWIAVAAPRIDMTAVIEESSLFADLCRFDAFSPLDRDDIAAYRRRRKLAARPVRFALPSAQGRSALVARAALSHLRQYDGLPALAMQGACLVPLGVLAVLGAGGPVLFLFWLQAVVMFPQGAREATRAFRDDVRNRLLRDRLPFSALELLAFDSLPAFAFTTLLACAAVPAIAAALPGGTLLAALVLAVLLNAATLLGCGLDAVRLFPGGPRLCYEYGALALVGTAFALALFAPLPAVVAGLALLCAVLAVLVRFGTECAR